MGKATRQPTFLIERKRPALLRGPFACVLALVVCYWASPSSGEGLRGKVIAIVDGDTIKLLDNAQRTHVVRLAGIDAPEKGQPFGSKSKDNLSRKIFGRLVEIDFQKTDRYGRIIGKVIVAGSDVNLAQLRDGMAWHYKQFERDQSIEDRHAYASGESLAKTAKIGLWQDRKPIAPWEFRRNKGKTL